MKPKKNLRRLASATNPGTINSDALAYLFSAIARGVKGESNISGSVHQVQGLEQQVSFFIGGVNFSLTIQNFNN